MNLQKGYYKKTKHVKISEKSDYFLPPDTHTCKHNVYFSENLACFVFLVTPILRFLRSSSRLHSPTLFLLYIYDLLNDVICDIAIYAYGDDTTLYYKCDQVSDQWQELDLASELESDLQDTVDWGKKWFVDFNAGKTQLVSFDKSNNTGAIDVKMHGSVLEEKSSFKMLGLTFSSKLDWGSYIISIAKTTSKKIGALIFSMKFLSPEVTLYLHKSTIHQCMKYCCRVWAGAPSCYLELSDKLQKRICRTAGPSYCFS